VLQELEIYQQTEFINQSNPRQFEVFVPNYTTKLKVTLNWHNESSVVTDWDLFVRNNGDDPVANSTNASYAANLTNLPRQEVIIHTGPFNTSFEGLWNISVINQSNDTSLNFYNLTVQIFLSAADWLNMSFNQSTSFNQSGTFNDSRNITATIGVPRTHVLNGTFKGMITYHNDSTWKLKLPVHFQVQAGHLFVNGNVSSSTVEHTENIGQNRTILLNIPYNNTGGSPIYYTSNTSSLGLMLTSNQSKVVNFTTDVLPPNPINPGTGGTINITIIINTSKTAETQGIYRGWIFFNTTWTRLVEPAASILVMVALSLLVRLRSIVRLNVGYG